MRAISRCWIVVTAVILYGSTPIWAGSSCGGTFPTCDGTCPPGQDCIGVGIAGDGTTSGGLTTGCACLEIAIQPCGDSFPQCGGICPPNEVCEPIFQGPPGATTSGIVVDCGCFPDIIFEPCGIAPECGGQCPFGTECFPALSGTELGTNSQIGPDLCFCQPVLEEPCGVFPTCGGECPEGLVCQPDLVAQENPGATTQGLNFPCFCQPPRPDFCGTAPECGGACDPGFSCHAGIFTAEGVKGGGDGGAATQGTMDPCFCIPDTPPGACCLAGDSCEELMAADCSERGGAFFGEGTSCAEAQCSDPGTFTVTNCGTPFEDISGSGTPLVLSDDDGEVVPLGFSFKFYSATQTVVGVSSNGYLSFGPDLTDFTTDPIPDPSDPNSLIAPFWDDFNPSQGGTVHHQTLGSAPNRRFVAQWTDVPEFFNDGTNTFQVLLFEGSNAIDFRYGPFDSSDGEVGVENALGLDGEAIPFGSVTLGACLRLTPPAAAGPAQAPALDHRALSALVLTLLAIALIGIRRARRSGQ